MPQKPIKPGRLEFDVANRLFFRLYQASNLMHKNGTRYVLEYGATTQQWAVIGALMRPRIRSKGMTVKELIEFLLLSRQNLTSTLDRLCARGWVERLENPEDGRSRLIRITDQGVTIWKHMQEPIAAFYSHALSEFSQNEVRELYILLDRLKNGLNQI